MAHKLNIGSTAHSKYGASPPPEPRISPHEQGLRDGWAGKPQKGYLADGDYISGYRSGSWWRYSERWAISRDELFEQMFRPRDPHREPTVWIA